jgi:hypothetical protein
MQEARPGKGMSEVQWEHFPLNPGAPNPSQEIERVLKENELLITEWAPIHLASVLKAWFWKDDVREVTALDVWQKSCQYLYLPRLKDDVAFQTTVGAGADSRDFFGIAQGMDEGRYVGFSFGKKTSVFMDSSLLLIEPITAAGFAEAQRAAEEARKAAVVTTGTGSTPPRAEDPTKPMYPPVPGATPQQPRKRQFYGTIELDPIQAKKQFADLVEEVVLQFTAKPGVKVRIAIEIQAETESGFDDDLQRAVKENCMVLKFKSAEFEQGE